MHSPSEHPGFAGRALGNIEPIAVTIRRACELTGLGATTIWKFGKERRIRLIRPPGTRRTLVDYPSLKNLLAQENAPLPPRRRGRPRKHAAKEATA